MQEIEGGELLVRSLGARGVERLFSVSGGPINSVYVAAAEAGMALHHVRHEGAAGFMADAYTRVTGTPGVAVVTLGPGVTNVLTPLATAALAGVPLLVLGGQAPTASEHRGAGMSVDVLPVVAPLVKWSARVTETRRIPEYVDAAWRQMWAGQPGPVYLEIPVDVLSGRAAPSLPLSAAPPPIAADGATVDIMVQALLASHRPLVLVGDDARWGGVERAELAAFADQFEVPVALARLARGTMDETHPRCLGPAYTPSNPALRQALDEADLVLLLGHTFDFDLGFGDGVSEAVTVLHVHRSAEQLGRNRPADVAMVADTGNALTALAGAGGDLPVTGRDGDWTRAVCAAWRGTRQMLLEQARHHPGDRLHPLELVDRVASAVPAGTTFVTSHGNIDFWADAHLQPSDPTRYLRAGQAGTLGAEIPYGVAAALARPNEAVVVFVGDGGFGFHALEVETAVRYGARVVVVIADDGKWGAISEPQRAAYGVEVEMSLPQRDWAQLARSLGARGERIDEPDDLAGAIARATAADGPTVLHVPIDTVLSPYMAAIS